MKKFKIKKISPAYTPLSKKESEFDFQINPQLKASDWQEVPQNEAIHKFYISQTAWQKIMTHIAWSEKTDFNIVEQGGLLLGDVYKDKELNYFYGLAKDVVSGDLAQGSPAYLDMNHQTWKKMIDEIDEKEQQVIGWYHTHPNSLDVFMSGTDMGTQRKMFSQDWQFAIVINPHRKIWRAFRGKEAEKSMGLILENEGKLGINIDEPEQENLKEDK